MTLTFVAVLVTMWVASDIEDNLGLINKGRAEEAVVNLQTAIEAEPENPRAHELLALAYLRLNKLDSAQTAATKAAELASDQALSVRITAARVAIARQNWTAAARELDKASSLDAENQEVRLYRGSLHLARKDYKAAVDTLSPYVTSNPDEAYGHYYLGLAHYGMKRPDRTVQQFQKFLALAPDAPEAARVESLLRSIR